MKKFFIYSLLAILIFNSSCNWMGKKLRGDGNIKTEKRVAGSFNGIEVSGSFDIYIRQDSFQAIIVEADQNLMEHIVVQDENGTLRIRPERGYNLRPTRRIKIYVSGNDFSSLSGSGACNIYGENKIVCKDKLSLDGSGACDFKLDVNAPRVSADLSGACDVNLSGETRDFIVEGSGKTDIKCFNLMAETVKVDISGAGDAEVFASVKLDVDVSGAGSVRYKGNAVVTKDISGAGSVKKIE
ncbi:MAG TPA: head GIN domain-containing protein [Chitinophagaceae bacterium]|nr:head GIN domain-containing protein [Chitinophagaceae bacterium]